MLNGSKPPQVEMTVGKLIDILSVYPGDLPIYFGATIEYDDEVYNEYGEEISVVFDDWLDVKDTQLANQRFRQPDGTIGNRDVLVVELEY